MVTVSSLSLRPQYPPYGVRKYEGTLWYEVYEVWIAVAKALQKQESRSTAELPSFPASQLPNASCTTETLVVKTAAWLGSQVRGTLCYDRTNVSDV